MSAWGVDIGQSAIKAVKMRDGKSGIEVIDYIVEPIELVEDVAVRAVVVGEALEAISKSVSFGSDPVAVSISAADTFIKEISVVDVGDSMEEAIRYEARQQIPFPIDDVLWGYREFERGEEGEDTGATLVAVRRTDIDALLGVLKECGLNVVAVQPEPLAIFNFIAYDQSPEECSVVLDMGARATTFLAMDKGHFWFRALQSGGDDVTTAIAQRLRIERDEAEELKVGDSKSAAKVAKIVAPLVRNIGGDVVRTVGFYRNMCRGVKFEEVILVGGGVGLPKLDAGIEAAVRMPVRTVETLEKIKVSSKGAEVEEVLAEAATAIGLGLFLLGKAEVDINLAPSELIEGTALEKQKPLVGVGVGVLFLAVLIAWFGAMSSADRLQSLDVKLRKFSKTMIEEGEGARIEEAGLNEMALRVRQFAHIGYERGQAAKVLRDLLTAKMRGENIFGAPNPVLDSEGVVVRAIYYGRDANPSALASSKVIAGRTWARALALSKKDVNLIYPKRKCLVLGQARGGVASRFRIALEDALKRIDSYVDFESTRVEEKDVQKDMPKVIYVDEKTGDLIEGYAPKSGYSDQGETEKVKFFEIAFSIVDESEKELFYATQKDENKAE